jgi:hypothetical protein
MYREVEMKFKLIGNVGRSESESKIRGNGRGIIKVAKEKSYRK